VEYSISDGLPYWRERILNGMVFVFFVFGTIAIVPNLIASINNQTHIITIADSIIYVVIAYLFFNKKVQVRIKVLLIITSIYILSIILLVMLGPLGPGLVWLSSGSIVAALLSGKRAAFLTIIVNTIIIAVLAILIYLNVFHTMFFENYTPLTWIAISLNVLLFTSISSVPIALLVEGLEKMFSNEKMLKKELEISNQQLKVEMEHTKETDRSKSAFLANLSHEIRTPMNAIIGFAELIELEEDKSPNLEKYSKYISQNSLYLQNLITDIVDISLIESGKISYKYEYTTINQIITELKPVIDSNPIRKRRPDLELKFECEKELLSMSIYTDITHLKQILINLISNSLKYTAEGFIKISVLKKGEMLEFCVKDTGAGIPIEEQSKIFQRFSKIEHKLKSSVPGIGIGLSITKSLTEGMKGKIWFESKEETGTSFYVQLPYNPE